MFLALNIGCGKKSSGGEGISNVGRCPVWYKDDDGDGYTDGTTKVSCEKPAGYVSQALPGDCDDNDKNINPNTVWFRDEDKDGYYPEGFTAVSCTAPAGYVLSAKPGDCNDNDPNINPGKAEICDGKDNNCNNQIDEGVLLVFYKDSDKDGYTDGTTKVSCEKPSDEYVSSATSWDCNDNDPNINPGKTEICDNKDNNCNGQIDEGNVCTFAKTIGGNNDDIATSIIQSSDGRYVVAGWTNSFGAGSYDFYVVKMDDNGNVCFSRSTTYSVLSNVGNVSSLSPVVISQSPTVNSVFPIVVSYGVSVKDVCALASAPHLNMCSESQECEFSSAIATNKENVKSYGCSAGSVFSRFLIPASMLIIYVQLRRKKKKKKG